MTERSDRRRRRGSTVARERAAFRDEWDWELEDSP